MLLLLRSKLRMLRLCLLLLAKRFPNERCNWLSLTRRRWPGIRVAASSSDDQRQCETDRLDAVVGLLLVPLRHIFIVNGYYDVTPLQMPVRWTPIEHPLYRQVSVKFLAPLKSESPGGVQVVPPEINHKLPVLPGHVRREKQTLEFSRRILP